MTPEQTEVIFEEYIEMNRVDENAQEGRQVVDEGQFFRPKTVETTKEGEGPTLAERVRSELEAKTRKSREAK